MAYPVEVTIGIGSPVDRNDKTSKCHVTVTYQLEESQRDIHGFVQSKASEVRAAYDLVVQELRGECEPERTTNSQAPTDIEVPQANLKITEADGKQGADAPSEDSGATTAQVEMIYSLCENAGIGRAEVPDRLRRAFKCAAPEELSQSQAAALLVALCRNGRERLKQGGDQKERGPKEER